jgi:hypothetical protein
VTADYRQRLIVSGNSKQRLAKMGGMTARGVRLQRQVTAIACIIPR